MNPAHVNQLQAVTFDLDGTLYPEYRMLLPTLGLAASHPRLLYCFSRVRKEIRSMAPVEDFRRLQAELMAKHLGSSVQRAATLIDRLIYGQWLNSLGRLRPFAGLRSIILRLREAGYKTALLSDMPIETKIKHLGLDGLWDCAYSSEESGSLKPNPRAFHRMLETLNLKPARIIYIGNNYEYDVIGASRVGMMTGLISARRHHERRADFNFRNSRELKSFLRSLVDSDGRPNPEGAGQA
jgi:putative hydrolase of the HAD superfamily